MAAEKKPLLIIWDTAGRERRVLIETEEFIIGRTLECHVILPDSFVSRQHASITQDGDYCHLSDLESANGTWLNGQRVGSEPLELTVGDVITLGHTVLSFTYLNAPTARLVNSALVVGMARREAEKRPMEEVEIPADRTSLYKRVFVSHATQDDDFVTKMAEALIPKAGVDLWIDHQNRITPGEDWDVAIQNALNKADYLIVVLSPDSVESQVVKAEWSYFWDRRKPIIPIIARACDVPFRLSALHYLNLEDNFDQGVTELAQGIARLMDQ